MKTVFKVGQKVYDQVHYPDYEGKVIKVYEDSILVIFEGVENYYSLDGRSGDSLPTLSTKPYKVEFPGFEQKSSVPTFEEAQQWMMNQKGNTSFLGAPNEIDKNFIDYSYYKAFEALKKLVILRDYYNEGWEPDWRDDDKSKPVIHIVNGELKCEENYSSKRTLAFRTKEIRNRFFEEQKELLKIAKPLL